MPDSAINFMQSKIEEGRVYDPKEVLDIIPVGIDVIYGLIRDGELKAWRIRGRYKIPWTALKDYIEKIDKASGRV
jgi:excisionase family DNA binding protein